MYYSKQVAYKMQAEKLLALKLEEALSGVKEDAIENIRRMEGGVTRISWYLSCLTTNYQDVCSRLKEEDRRFVFALAKLVKGEKVVYLMIFLYVNLMLAGKNSRDLEDIKKLLIGLGVNISSSFLSSQSMSAAITTSICFSLNFRTKFNGTLHKLSSTAVLAASLYGYVQQAAESAHRLKVRNPVYYQALYRKDVEMLYFIVEPALIPTFILNRMFPSSHLTNYQIANSLAELAK